MNADCVTLRGVGAHTGLRIEHLAGTFRRTDEALRILNLRRRMLNRGPAASARDAELLMLDVDIAGRACELMMLAEDMHAAGIPEPATVAAVAAAVEFAAVLSFRAALALCNAAVPHLLHVPRNLGDAAAAIEILKGVDQVQPIAVHVADVMVDRFGGEVLNAKGMQTYLMTPRGSWRGH